MGNELTFAYLQSFFTSLLLAVHHTVPKHQKSSIQSQLNRTAKTSKASVPSHASPNSTNNKPSLNHKPHNSH